MFKFSNADDPWYFSFYDMLIYLLTSGYFLKKKHSSFAIAEIECGQMVCRIYILYKEAIWPKWATVANTENI